MCFLVALFARAWIEMILKTLQPLNAYVALFARAWIEMFFSLSDFLKCQVALFARAWIEIRFIVYIIPYICESPSLRGRGLKSMVALFSASLKKSPSLRGRGLK